MDTALQHYGYSARTPVAWHMAVSKNSSKTRFQIDYPFVKPYFVEPGLLELGLTDGEIDGVFVRIADKERAICDCLRYRNKMDQEIFNKVVQSYIADPESDGLCQASARGKAGSGSDRSEAVMTDQVASVLARLKNKAKTSGISYQQCLQLFFRRSFCAGWPIRRIKQLHSQGWSVNIHADKL